jgi:ATP-dependent DNA ligase
MFVAFDLLRLDGAELTGQPYEERRRELVNLGLDGAACGSGSGRHKDTSSRTSSTRGSDSFPRVLVEHPEHPEHPHR